jgi:general secretion pathway protein J
LNVRANLPQRAKSGATHRPHRGDLRQAGGFTLIELVISSALMVLVLAGAYVCMQAAVSGRKLIESRSDLAQTARTALSLISADLRNACALSQEYEFLGMDRMLEDVEADNLDFATHNYTPRAVREGDFCEVSYFITKNEETDEITLWRRRDPSPDPEPLAGGSREEIAHGLRGFKLEYYDGFDWFDEWGDPLGKRREADTSTLLATNLSGLPEAVRITLLLAPKAGRKPVGQSENPESTPEPPQVFQTVVRVNLAPVASMSSSTGPSTSSNSGQPNNESGNPGGTPMGPGGPQ